MSDNQEKDILKENQEKMRELIDEKEQDDENNTVSPEQQKRENQSIEDQARVPDRNNAMKPTVANRKAPGYDD